MGFNWTYQSGTPNSAWDDGSTSNGYAPGWDTQHVVFTNPNNLSGDPIVANTDAAYNNAANYDANGYWISTDSSLTHRFLDIGYYGNAVAGNGAQGNSGRTPALNNVDLHLDWAYKIGKRFRVIPSVDVFNLFNTRYATSQLQQVTDQGGNPDVRYGTANAWQIGRRYRFGVKFQF